MRLINTNSLEFEEFFKAPSKKYAILSHRWGDNEVSYEEYLKELEKNPGASLKNNRPRYLSQGQTGMVKIVDFCTKASENGHEYAWIDTCCIDKKSSAELTESINSMYKWYQKSTRCYVYLSDSTEEDWKRSVWWQRGWTLQELIAPKKLTFYDQDWSQICDKDKKNAPDIAAVANLPERLINGEEPDGLDAWCAGVKMHWASRRTTTRDEDEAYCLLGLFGVNMPLIYGEGRNAFRRLQRILFEQSGDETIFAFVKNTWHEPYKRQISMFATSPRQFTTRTSTKGYIEVVPPWRSEPPRFTTWGLEIVSDAIKLEFHWPNGSVVVYYIVRLACGWFVDQGEITIPSRTACYIPVWRFVKIRPGRYRCTRLPSTHLTDVESIVKQLKDRHSEEAALDVRRSEVEGCTFYIDVDR